MSPFDGNIASDSHILNVVCVLKSGGVYDIGYVTKLASAVRRKLTPPYRFYCLTDLEEINRELLQANLVIPLRLRHRWPGWWSKIELFRPSLFAGQVLYFDLDTIVPRRLEDIASYRGAFAILRDFYRPDGFGSALISWRAGKLDFLYDDFASDPRGVMRRLAGDQDWIEERVAEEGMTPDRFQDLFPGQVVSYKPVPGGPHLAELPAGARIVCFHGLPKPHEAAAEVDWVAENWK